MYCGACARDAALARGLLRLGHQVEIVPLYTPLRLEGDESPTIAPVRMGGINAYLEQVLPFWRAAPAGVRNLLDNSRLLAFAARFAVSTKASDLGPMMVSVLRGIEGRQGRSIEEVARYVVRDGVPDLVSITNSLLSGVAPAIRRLADVPIVCALQGEDGFVDAAKEPWRSEARRLMQANARSIDAFLSPSRAYAEVMADYLAAPPEKFHLVRAGIETEPFRRSGRTRVHPFTIGYLSVITPAKGLDLLLEAVLELVEAGRDFELLIAGRVLDPRYGREVARRVAERGAGRVRFLGELTFEQKVQFLHSCSLLCVPTRLPESRGIVALEAQAAGVPVVVPNHGVFPEMLELTHGGRLFEPGDSRSLRQVLEGFLADPDAAWKMGAEGAEGVVQHFSAKVMVEQALEVFEAVRRPLGRHLSHTGTGDPSQAQAAQAAK